MAHSAGNKDQRLMYADLPSWQLGTRQALQGSDYMEVVSTGKISSVPQQVDFDIQSQKCLLFGPMSRFVVQGAFQVQAKAADPWKNCDEDEIIKVVLQPNWFEHLVKEVSIFHNNYRIASSNEARFIAPFLNTYLYNYMEPTSKKLLCPESCHPAYCVPGKKDSWSATNDDWKKYAAGVFANKAIRFNYIPLFMFPFYQGSNFFPDCTSASMLPMPVLGRLQIRFTFFDKHDHIFRKVQNNTSSYRFAFDAMSLYLEEARLPLAYEKQFLNAKKQLVYPGVTRLQLIEPVPNGSTTYRTRFQEIFMPEALFIFCLHKKAASGTFSFAEGTVQNVFLAHNIVSLDLSFDGKRFSLREPHIGSYQSSAMDTKHLFDHLAVPPFGVKLDPNKLTLEEIAEGAKNSCYPHLYVPLTTGIGRNRLIPAQDDGSCTTKKADLDIDIKFSTTTSQDNTVYVIYACYTDASVVFDPKNRNFFSPYLQYMN